MEKAKKFEDLLVWRKSHELTIQIYEITKSYPPEEKFGLVSQMRRAAVSIPANIAEGFNKRGMRDKANFYNIAQASLEELRYYLILSKDLGFYDKSRELDQPMQEIGKMLQGLAKSMRKRTVASGRD